MNTTTFQNEGNIIELLRLDEFDQQYPVTGNVYEDKLWYVKVGGIWHSKRATLEALERASEGAICALLCSKIQLEVRTVLPEIMEGGAHNGPMQVDGGLEQVYDALTLPYEVHSLSKMVEIFRNICAYHDEANIEKKFRGKKLKFKMEFRKYGNQIIGIVTESNVRFSHNNESLGDFIEIGDTEAKCVESLLGFLKSSIDDESLKIDG